MSIRVTQTKKGKRYAPRVHVGGGKYRVLGTFATRKEAKAREAEWELTRSAPERVLGRQFAKRWLKDYGAAHKASSASTAETSISHWLKTFGNRSLRTITRDEAREWAEKNRWACGAVVTMMNEAKEDKLIERNPFKGAAKKGRGRAGKTPLTVEEVDRLAEVAQSLWGASMRAVVLFAAYSGMRVGEIFALTWDDIDFENSRILIRRRLFRGELDLPKGGRVKEVSLLPEARDALIPLDRSTEWIFTGTKGKRLSQSGLSYYWKPIAVGFGRPVTPHELRHFCGHHLYVTLGYPARVVAAQLTHSGPRLVEELYGHGDVGALEEIERTYTERSNVIPLRRASGE